MKVVAWFRRVLRHLQPPGNRVPLEDDPRMPGSSADSPPHVTLVEHQ